MEQVYQYLTGMKFRQRVEHGAIPRARTLRSSP